MEASDIDNRFSYHAPAGDSAAEAHERVRWRCRSLAHDLNILLAEGRQKSLAVTALEDVMMRANASIAQDGLP